MSNPRSSSRPVDDVTDHDADISVTLVTGTLSRAAETRVLPSGDTLVALEVTTRLADGTAESMPVAWLDPPPWVGRLDAGERVVVLGRVRRRFYRAGGATVSRTEVLAERVVPLRRRSRSGQLFRLAQARLAAADPLESRGGAGAPVSAAS